MSEALRTTACLTVLALGALVIACSGGVQEAPIGQSELASQMASRMDGEPAPLILDVRSASEFAAGHVPTARNIPHHELRDRLAELDAAGASEIVVYCERGGRAQRAIALLRDAGFSRVRHLEGDMRAWRGSGLPCEGC